MRRSDAFVSQSVLARHRLPRLSCQISCHRADRFRYESPGHAHVENLPRVALERAGRSVRFEFAVAAVKLLSIVALSDSVRPGQENSSAELVAALSLATDLGNGYPLEKTLRTCLLAIRLADLSDFPRPDKADVYYLTLLRSIA